MGKVLIILGCALAAAQTPGPGQRPAFSPDLQRYLELTNEQLLSMVRIHAEFQRLYLEKQLRAGQVQRELVEEMGRESLDPPGIGLRYAEIETIRRQLRDEWGRGRARLTALLTDAQKARLRALEEARKLRPLIDQAECENLLEPVREALFLLGRIEDQLQLLSPILPRYGCGTVFRPPALP